MAIVVGAVAVFPAGLQYAILLRAKKGCKGLSNPEGPTNAGMARLATSVQNIVMLSAAGDAGALAFTGMVIPSLSMVCDAFQFDGWTRVASPPSVFPLTKGCLTAIY